jgi:hypothetical protein
MQECSVESPLHIIRRFTQHYRNDYIGVEQFSRTIDGDHYLFLPSLYEQHQKVAVLWDKNLRSQGFVEAFDRSRTQP